MQQKQNTLYVSSLAKGLQLLRAFDDRHSELTLTEMTVRTGLERSAVQRLANTLHLEGMLNKNPVTRRFSPSHAWLQLAYAYYWSDRLVPIALPKMIDLSQRLGETVNLAEASGDHIIYVSRLPCQHTYFAASVVGRRIPALSTSSGLAMLSTCDVDTSAEAVVTWPLTRFTPRTIMERSLISEQVEQARQEGFSIAREQVILNEIGIAAPIRSPGGEPSRAAIQCSVSASRWTEEGLRERIVPALLDTANAISPDPRS
ncbi:IclR family transcriptional regulator [Sedimentitalea nanhaiensis]|uniref:Transcriptional regulator, IclR family n=1 Tax=Sedimentitalea nanhaiensis TaxID=999627 RepID=A0A1I6Z4G2_9RHOB|nr:IclR family transcriptional regulator [Sedimentitalea nanhaiensis]SFT57623.1 transcriptional regulator, IclR family [Sedimentitalea nanhaiensis]